MQSHGLRYTRLLSLPLSPWVYSNSCSLTSILSKHLILCPVFSFCLSLTQYQGFFFFPPVSHLFTSGGQSIGASALASVLPRNIQGWPPLGMTGLISLLSWGLSRVYCNTTIQKHQFFGTQLPLWSISHICTWLLKKTVDLTIWTFVHISLISEYSYYQDLSIIDIEYEISQIKKYQ